MFILKNNQYFWFFLFHVFFLITILSVDVVVFVSSSSINKRFEACQPQHCGNGRHISFPFWIHGIHQDYCGYPEFKVTCKNDEPVLQSFGNDYIIRDIFYEKQSFRVANSIGKGPEFDSCPSPIQNVSFASISPFKLGPKIVNLSFFYNCTNDTTYFPNGPDPNSVFYPKNCRYTDSQHFSVVMASVPAHLDYWNSRCKTLVSVPVEIGGGRELSTGGSIFIDRGNYTLLVEKGFILEWNKMDCKQCEDSGGSCGFFKEVPVCICGDQPYLNPCNIDRPKAGVEPDSKKGIKIAIGVSAGVVGFCLACFCTYLFFYLRRRKNQRSISSNLISQNITPDSSWKPDPENGSTYFATPIFSYEELEEATNNFDSNRELGDGGFGTVYRGELRDGRVVAVKRLYENNFKRVEQFMNEVNILSLLRHENLVTLYGCTSRHSRELLLVYEYVPNGTVADHIHGELAKAGLATWPIRMNIAIESAGALKYLHASDIIHRDVKTNNILLDKNFHVKVADFGLSRLFPTDVTHVSTAPQGTPGYVDPEYYQCYQLTDKSDVYSFGVVLIELISSKPAVDISRHRHDINLANMAINKIQNHSLSELVDPRLGFETDNQARRMITLVAELAFRCLQQDRDMRPSMVEVLEVLKGIAGEEDNVVKAVEVIDIPADHDVVRLLKNDTAPFSPISVTDKWGSVASTPNTSS